MSDLPRQLRELHTLFGQSHQVLLEAASEIERLERELAVLRAAPGRTSGNWDLP